MKDRTLWLDTLKKNVEKKSTEAHKRAARALATSANAFSETLVQHTDKTDRGLDKRGGLLACGALLGLFEKDQEWRCFFKSCCELSTCRLMAQAWQFGDELKGRGHRFPAEEVEDALLGLASDLLPESAAAGWVTEWAHALCKDALARSAEHYAVLSTEEKYALDLSGQDVWDERMRAAGLNNDPAAFRAALEGWERAGLEAMKQVGARGGAA